MDTSTGKIKTYTAEEVLKEIVKAGGKLPPVSEEKDVATLMQSATNLIPLKRLPRKNCKKCYGRGHLGRNLITGKFVPCSCTI